MLYKAQAEIDPQREDELTELLFAYNAISVSSEQDGAQTILTATLEELNGAGDFLAAHHFVVTELSDEEWKYTWLEHYTGGELTPKIYITPALEIDQKEEKEGYKWTIRLDPRDAFGDGNHPTTRQCALFLEKILTAGQNKPVNSLLDAGTGTGILAIIAALYGVPAIDAMDIEEESIQRSRVNCRLNGTEKVNLFCADIGEYTPDYKYDLICANLLTEILTCNIDHLIALGSDHARFIISGISEIWRSEMEQLFATKHLRILDSSVRDEWCCFVLQKRL